MLLSFKIADLVNIALDEGTYFKSKEWKSKNASKMMVEHKQEDWSKELLEGIAELKTQEKNYAEADTAKIVETEPFSDKLAPLIKFFKTLKQ